MAQEVTDRQIRKRRVLARACEALGDPKRAQLWMTNRNSGLNGRRPVDLLDSEAGAREVVDILQRIEHGVYG
jgi:putative toxin-antitoxin system antitoxin component (TIGR02293 family)